MASRTRATFGSNPSATARTAMSRSVRVPTSRSSTPTGKNPMSASRICWAASRSTVSGSTSSTISVMTSRIFIVLSLDLIWKLNAHRGSGESHIGFAPPAAEDGSMCLPLIRRRFDEPWRRSVAGWFAALKTLQNAADRDEEYRGQEQPQERHANHAGKDGHADRLPQLGTRPGGDGKRNHAEREGERGHDDRAEPVVRGVDGGPHGILAFRLPLTGELDDQDGVLGGKADQHDEADLGQDVVVGALQHHAHQSGQNGQRRDQDDRQRQRPALV